jgi:hypothetical protein
VAPTGEIEYGLLFLNAFSVYLGMENVSQFILDRMMKNLEELHIERQSLSM